jgi:hypothetical protein
MGFDLERPSYRFMSFQQFHRVQQLVFRTNKLRNNDNPNNVGKRWYFPLNESENARLDVNAGDRDMRRSPIEKEIWGTSESQIA